MTIDIAVRFSVSPDTTVSSTFKLERSFDFSSWSTLDVLTPTTTTLVSTALGSNTTVGATSIALTSGTSVPSSGYGWIDNDALVQWTGKTTDTLTGVTWHSGYGTFSSGSAFVVASESYEDGDITPTNNAVVYRITHIDANANESAPAYFWYYYPPAPASDNHCVVIVAISSDLGILPRANVTVTAYLTADTQFAGGAGQHLDSNVIASNSQVTNALGLAFFQCWRNSRRSGVGGTSDASYVFVLDSTNAAVSYSVVAATIPDRDWVLLRDIGA